MAISRMQEPRQLYGLGSLVKKAVRGVKKIVKSPIGKAALLGGLGMYAGGLGPWSSGGMWGQAKGAGFLRNMMAARNLASMPAHLTRGMGGTPAGGGFFSRMLGGAGKLLNPWQSGKFSGKHAFGLGAAALTAMPFLMGKDDAEEEVEEAWTSVPSSIADIRNQARAHYRDPSGSTLAFMPNVDYVNPQFYAAHGGRAGLMNGGEPGQEQIEQMLMAEFVKYKNQGGTLTFEQFVQAVMQAQQEGQGMEQPQEVAMAANGGLMGQDEDEYNYNPQAAMRMYKRPGKQEGGRIGLKDGTPEPFATGWWHPSNKPTDEQLREWELERLERQKKALEEYVEPEVFTTEDIFKRDTPITEDLFGLSEGFTLSPITMLRRWLAEKELEKKTKKAQGGRIGKQEGGIMETEVADEMIDMDGQEKDYRETGGFVEIGGKERADDVPARLSKNEFVFTADAVRNAGGGDIDKGSEVMQNLMDNLEAGGEVSEDSQGLEGAQAMYDQQQMLQSRIA